MIEYHTDTPLQFIEWTGSNLREILDWISEVDSTTTVWADGTLLRVDAGSDYATIVHLGECLVNCGWRSWVALPREELEKDGYYCDAIGRPLKTSPTPQDVINAATKVITDHSPFGMNDVSCIAWAGGLTAVVICRRDFTAAYFIQFDDETLKTSVTRWVEKRESSGYRSRKGFDGCTPLTAPPVLT